MRRITHFGALKLPSFYHILDFVYDTPPVLSPDTTSLDFVYDTPPVLSPDTTSQQREPEVPDRERAKFTLNGRR